MPENAKSKNKDDKYDIQPGVGTKEAVVYDEPESSWSPSSSKGYPAVPLTDPEDLPDPDSDELKDAHRKVAVASNVGNYQPAIFAEQKVSHAPTVFGAAPESPVIIGEEDDSDFMPGEGSDSPPEEESDSEGGKAPETDPQVNKETQKDESNKPSTAQKQTAPKKS